MATHDLIVLESPNKVDEVQRYAEKLGLRVKLLATFGHLLDLPPMAEGACVDTSTFTAERIEPRNKRAADRIEWLQDAIAKAARVIVATDPDREGEAIAAQVWQWIPPARAWRATFQEITASGIERGLAAMRPELNAPAAEAATTRRIVDRLAGWHATAVVFEKLRKHKGISAGRLQSAALRLVVERHREHARFRSTTTFGLRLRVRTGAGDELSVALLDDDGTPRSVADRAEAAAHRLPERLTVRSIDRQLKSQKPRPPFDAPSWLQVAQKALGLSVKDASLATQTLFEKGLTSYPRTDTVRVSDEAIECARTEIARRFGPEYVAEKPWAHKDRAGDVQGAHEAIRPTLASDPADLERRHIGELAPAYALIEARFLASQAAARVVEQTTIALEGQGCRYRARGERELFAGWKRVLDTDAAEEEPAAALGDQSAPDADEPVSGLPPLAAADEVEVIGSDIVPQTTRPKPLFTQAALVAELKRLGIGRPSTYPGVVPLLLSRGWVVEQPPASSGKKRASKKTELPVLVPTEIGFDLSDFLAEAFPGLVDYNFTAELERALDEIEAGKRSTSRPRARSRLPSACTMPCGRGS